MLKRAKIITAADVLQLRASELSQTQCKKKKKKKDKETGDEQELFLMLNKRTPSAANYAVRTMKWHFTMHRGVSFQLSCQTKLNHTFIFMCKHTALHFKYFPPGSSSS